MVSFEGRGSRLVRDEILSQMIETPPLKFLEGASEWAAGGLDHHHQALRGDATAVTMQPPSRCNRRHDATAVAMHDRPQHRRVFPEDNKDGGVCGEISAKKRS